MVFTRDHYYMVEMPVGTQLLFTVDLVENWPTCVPLGNGETVVCAGFVQREMDGNTGRYARLLHYRGEQIVTLFHRVDRLNTGYETWRELGSLEVLAMADILPAV